MARSCLRHSALCFASHPTLKRLSLPTSFKGHVGPPLDGHRHISKIPVPKCRRQQRRSYQPKATPWVLAARFGVAGQRPASQLPSAIGTGGGFVRRHPGAPGPEFQTRRGIARMGPPPARQTERACMLIRGGSALPTFHAPRNAPHGTSSGPGSSSGSCSHEGLSMPPKRSRAAARKSSRTGGMDLERGHPSGSARPRCGLLSGPVQRL